MHRFASRPLAIAFLATAALIAAACSGTDDGASVREIGESSESVSALGIRQRVSQRLSLGIWQRIGQRQRISASERVRVGVGQRFCLGIG